MISKLNFFQKIINLARKTINFGRILLILQDFGEKIQVVDFCGNYSEKWLEDRKICAKLLIEKPCQKEFYSSSILIFRDFDNNQDKFHRGFAVKFGLLI